MTAPTLPSRHRTAMTEHQLAPPPARLSRRGWTAVKRSATATVFVLATIVGVALGVRGVEISPVSPPVAVAAAVAPAAVQATAGPATAGFGTTPPGSNQRPGSGQGGRGRLVSDGARGGNR